MPHVTGTLNKVMIDGEEFKVAADTDATEIGSEYENEALPTTGEALRKMTKRVQSVEGIILHANGAQKERLKEIADSRNDVNMSYETRAGDVWRARGFIEFENRTTEEDRATVNMHPRRGWKPFLA